MERGRAVAPREGPGQGRQARRPREHPGCGGRRSSTATSAPSSSSRARPTSRPRPTTSPRWCRTWPSWSWPRATTRVAERQTELDDLKITKKENIELGTVVRFEARRRQHPRHLPAPAGRPRRQRRARRARRRHQGAGPRHRRARRLRQAAVPRPATRCPPTRSRRSARRCSSITKAEGKPEQAWPKIVEGRLNAWFKDQVLLEQGFVQDEKQTITELLGDATIVRFAQVFIGA